MKNFQLAIKISAVLSVLFYLSCSFVGEEDILAVAKTPSSTRSLNSSDGDRLPYSDTVRLGAKLQNPYAIDTMRQAIKALIDSGIISAEFKNISPTHLYVRFLPLDSADMDAIYFNPDLILFPYPLDYEILTCDGNYYRDPDLPVGQPNSQYSVVPVGTALPNVQYEILAQLYLNEDGQEPNATNTRSANGISSFDYSLIEQKAFAVSNVEYDKPSPNLRASKWRPSGQIKVFDRSLNDTVGVPGIEIITRNWFNVSRVHTNKNGYFTSGEYSGKDVSFKIRWQYANNRFDIRCGGLGQAFTDGPNKSTTWNKTLEGENAFWAIIFRAGWYYINNDFGFGDKPFSRVSVQARYDGKARKGIVGLYNGFSENLNIWGKDYYGNKLSDYRIFSTSVHEFAHAHHDEIFGGIFAYMYLKEEGRLAESWADGVQYFISSLVYSVDNVGREIEYDRKQKESYWQNKDWSGENAYMERYTPLIIDLVDDYDQDEIIDKVSGYTLKQIADILAKSDCRTFGKLKEYLKQLDNPTKEYLDILFAEMEKGGDEYSAEIRMLEFQERLWSSNGTYDMSLKKNSSNTGIYLNFKSKGTTNMTTTGTYPIKYLKSQNWKRVGVRVRLSMPENTPWIPTWYYAGNLQISVADAKNGAFNWAGQFDINKNGGYIYDGKYFVQYEMILPDYIAQKFKQSEQYLRLMFSANAGAEFNIHKIEFFDANEDENRVLNLTAQQKNNAVSYSTFIADPSKYCNYVTVSPDLIVYKIINGQKHYYKPGQDVNEQMTLVERWAVNPAYEPGLPSGFWRQCWIYLGKE